MPDLLSQKLWKWVSGSCALRNPPGDFESCSNLTTTGLEAEGKKEGTADDRGSSKKTARRI